LTSKCVLLAVHKNCCDYKWVGLGNARSKWEGLGLDFWSKVGNGSQYFELNIEKVVIAKCSRMDDVMVCALMHEPNSLCSSIMAPHYY